MEVSLPRQEYSLDFSDSSTLAKELDENIPGSYSWNFARFLHLESHKLQILFIPRDIFHPDRGEYIRVFDGSRERVRSILELMWCSRFDYNFDYDNFKQLVLKVEGLSEEVEQAMAELKHKVEQVPRWEKNLLQYKLDDGTVKRLLKALDAIKPEMKEVTNIHNKYFSYQRMSLDNSFKIAIQIYQYRKHSDDSIEAELGAFLLDRLLKVSFAESHQVRSETQIDLKIYEIQLMIREGNKWLGRTPKS